jgi:DNA invertase Pin-like site-specific DNA recombinase
MTETHPQNRLIGYARVSTYGQTLDTELPRMLSRLLDQLAAGDVLMVTRVDRLARSTRELLNTLAAIASRQSGFRSLGETWADTTAHGRLMLTILSGLAAFERDLIRARVNAGRELATARGVKLGRKPKLTAH